MKLKITNRARDYVIEQLKQERQDYGGKLMSFNRKLGEFETKLLQLEPPSKSSSDDLKKGS